MKRIIAFLTALIMIIAFSACDNTAVVDPASEEPAEIIESQFAEPVNKVLEPSFSFVAKKNNITIDTIESYVDAGQTKGGSYIQISGLKNAEVQSKINSELKATFDDLVNQSELPRYTGIKIKSRGFEDKTPYTDNVSAISAFNSFNILSVCYYKSVYYEPYEEDGQNYYFEYSDIATLNFDLNTGKQIRLADMLADGFDISYFDKKMLDIINDCDATNEVINWFSPYNFHLIQPFSGFKEDQKYYISEYSGNINVVLDYNNPEFFVDGYPATVEIDIKDAAGYQQKFAGTDLYTNANAEYYLLVNPFDSFKYKSDYKEYHDIFEGYDIPVTASLNWYDDAPASVIAAARANPLEKPHNGIFIEAYESLLDSYMDYELNAYVYYDTYTDRYGDYSSVVNYSGETISRSSDWESLYSYYSNQNRCFDRVGNELMLEDIFEKPEEMHDLIIDAWMSNANNDYPEWSSICGEDYLTNFFEAAYERLNGFYLAGDAVIFSFDNLDNAVTLSFFAGEGTWRFSNMVSAASYADLGCNNLNIFNGI